MFPVPENILQELKCCQCKEIISSPPIYSKKNSDSLCGQCIPLSKSQKKNMVRNHLFEALAEYLIFPCKYAQEGCKTELKWGRTNEHTENCEFGITMMLKCPALPTEGCTWRGLYKNILQHYKRNHADYILKHPYEMKPYETWIVNDMKKLQKVTFRNFLMQAHGFIFLLRFKVCFQSDSLWICATFLGEPKLVAHFESVIELVCHNTENLLHIIQVHPNLNVFNEKLAVKIALHKKIKISINLNTVSCTSCGKVHEKIPPNVKFCCNEFDFVSCSAAKPKYALQRCLFYEFGCPYIDNPENMPKHVTILCKYNIEAICARCHKKISSKKQNMFEHLKSHIPLTFLNEFYVDRNEIVGTNSEAVWKTKKGTFLVKWGTVLRRTMFNFLLPLLNNEEILFACTVTSDIPINDEKKLILKLNFMNNLTGEKIIGVLNRTRLDNDKFPFKYITHEWRVAYPLDNFMHHVYYTFNLYLVNALE